MNSQSWKSGKGVGEWGLGAKDKVEHDQQTEPDQEKETQEQSRGRDMGGTESISKTAGLEEEHIAG